MSGTSAIVGGAITVGAAYNEVEAARDQAKAAKQAASDRQQQAQLEQQRADIKAAQDARASIRAARAATGAIVNSAANSGATLSSGAAGGVASVGSQLGYNLGTIEQNRSIDNEELVLTGDIAGQTGRAAGDAARAQEWGVYGSLGSSIFNAAGGYSTLFGANKKLPG